MTKRIFHLRNVLVLVGIVITGVGIIYFASEFIHRLSDWGRVSSLVLLGIVLLSVGRWFELTGQGEIVEKEGWRWFRIPTALYLLAILSLLTAVIAFLAIDRVDRLVKAAVAILVGLTVLILGASRIREE